MRYTNSRHTLNWYITYIITYYNCPTFMVSTSHITSCVSKFGQQTHLCLLPLCNHCKVHFALALLLIESSVETVVFEANTFYHCVWSSAPVFILVSWIICHLSFLSHVTLIIVSVIMQRLAIHWGKQKGKK